jgi:hypothetical protein
VSGSAVFRTEPLGRYLTSFHLDFDDRFGGRVVTAGFGLERTARSPPQAKVVRWTASTANFAAASIELWAARGLRVGCERRAER